MSASKTADKGLEHAGADTVNGYLLFCICKVKGFILFYILEPHVLFPLVTFIT